MIAALSAGTERFPRGKRMAVKCPSEEVEDYGKEN